MTLTPRRGLADAVAAARAVPPTDAEVPPEIATWLRSLAALTPVPVDHLVPDPEMLPPESIRFFHVDPHWVAALLTGACSVGRSGSADLELDASLAGPLVAAAAPSSPVTGFLLRSAVVEGWPGLEVSVQDAQGTALSALRMERLAPGLLIHLVEGVLAAVEIHEPAEGLHFGVDLKAGDPESGDLAVASKQLRALAEPSPGTPLPDITASVQLRDAGRRVLDVAGTAAAIRAALGLPEPFTAAEFALEMVEGVQSVRFTVNDP